MSDFDPISKMLVENYGSDIIQLIRGHKLEYRKEHLLDKDITVLRRQSDVVLRVKEDDQEYIICIEIQTRKDPGMAMRMLEYVSLLHRKYGLPVYPVLINLTGRTSKSSYGWGCVGLTVIALHYHCIDLARLDAEDYLYRAPVGLVPFIPLMHHRIPSEELLVECSRRIEEDITDPVERANMYVALSTLAQLRLCKLLIFKVIEVSKVENSPHYDLIKEKWEARGKLEGKLEDILELLLDNVGNYPPEIKQRLTAITDELILGQLLRKAAKTNSLEEFSTALDELTNKN